MPEVLSAFDPQIRWSEAEGYVYADGSPNIGSQAVALGVFQRLASDFSEFAVVPQSFIDGFQQYTDTKQWADALAGKAAAGE